MAKNREDNNPNINAGVALLVVAVIIAGIVGVWAESITIAVILVIVGFVLSTKVAISDSLTPTRELPSVNYIADGGGKRNLMATEYTCRIAGITHHASSRDIGGFVGVICSDPSNPYDKKVVGIYTDKGKLLGYIPKDELDEFRQWSLRDPLPCIGYIREGDKSDLYGRVKIIDADKNMTEIHMIKYAIWMIDNFGGECIPEKFFRLCPIKGMNTKQWLDYLDDQLEEKKAIKTELDKIAKKKGN